jgi:hypothetical protein
MNSKAKSIPEYLAGLPGERRRVLVALRALIRKRIPKGYQEAPACGMIGWQVPLKVCPETYNGQPLQYLAIGAQKRHLAIYLMNAYACPAVKRDIVAGFKAAGKRLDMGKSCIRFRSLDDLPLDVIARAVAATPLKDFVAVMRKGLARRNP